MYFSRFGMPILPAAIPEPQALVPQGIRGMTDVLDAQQISRKEVSLTGSSQHSTEASLVGLCVCLRKSPKLRA